MGYGTAVYSCLCTDHYWGSDHWAGEVDQDARDAKYSTRHYTSMNAWDVARARNLVSADEEEWLNIVGDDWTSIDSSSVILDDADWDADLTHRIVIRALGDARNSGIYPSNGYRLETGTSTIPSLEIQCGYVWLQSFAIRHTLGSGTRSNAINSRAGGPNTATIWLDDMVCRGGRYTCKVEGGKSWIVHNTIMYGSTEGAFVTINPSDEGHLRNSTFIGGARGIYAYKGIIAAANCYAYGSTGSYIEGTGKLFDFMMKCASNDTNGSTGLQNIAYSTDNFVNVTSGSEDLHLASGSALKAVGVPLFNVRSKPHIDVSSVIKFSASETTGAILTIAASGSTANVKFRNHGTTSWIDDLELDFDLRYAYTGGSELKIAIISDTHYGYTGDDTDFAAAINDIDDNIGNVDKVFVLGDITTDGASANYDNYVTKRATSDISTSNWYELAGNHDNPTTLESKTGSAQYYAVTIDNMIFIFLGVDALNSHTIGSTAAAWLGTTLAANQDKNIIILTHQAHRATNRLSTRDVSIHGYLDPADTIDSHLKSYDWDAWFNGHAHGYATRVMPDGAIYYDTEWAKYDIDGDHRNIADIGADCWPALEINAHSWWEI